MNSCPDDKCGHIWPEDQPTGEIPEHGQSCCYRDTYAKLDACLWHADLSNLDPGSKPDYSTEVSDEIEEVVASPTTIRLDGADLSDIDENPTFSFTSVSLRGANFGEIETDDPDFNGSNLEGADFSGVTLVNPDFRNAVLNGADFENTRIIIGNFNGAEAKNVDFTDSQLINCEFSNAKLSKSDFTDADFNNIHYPHFDHLNLDPSAVGDHTYFTNAILKKAVFTDVSLVDGIFRGARLSNADFSSSADPAFTENILHGNKNVTLLTYCDFTDADCTGVDFSNSICSDADFHNASVKNGEIVDANVSGTRFTEANLRGTNFKDANLEDGFLDEADVSEGYFDKADLRDVSVRGMVCDDTNFARTTLFSIHGAEKSQFENAMIDGRQFTESDIFDLVESESLEAFFETKQEADLAKVGLSDTDLSGLDLREVDLYQSDLSCSDLSNTNMHSIRLEGADLFRANLEHAELCETNLSEADLSNADIDAADLSVANLKEANLTEATVTNGDLSETVLTDADLGKADLENADLTDANLQSAGLQEANLEHTVFVRTNLFDVDLTGCEPHGATFTDVQINSDTELRSESIRQANAEWWQRGPFLPARRCGYDPANADDENRPDITQLGKAADTYQTFEKLARENARPSLQSEMFVLRQDMQRKRHWHTGEYNKWLFARTSRTIFKYGESLGRIAISAIVSIAIFGVIYNSFNLITATDGSFVSSPIDALYFSTLTFTTLGLGDFKPVPTSELARVLVTTQAALGAIIIAIFVFVLGRRAAK